MAITVKGITLWRREIDDRPGALASSMEPLTGVDLQVVMAYRFTGNTSRGAVELYPIGSKKSITAAQSAGFVDSGIPALIVTGDNRPGLGHAIAKAIADAGINLAFVVAQVIGRRYSAVFGFDSAGDRQKAIVLVKKAHTGGRKR